MSACWASERVMRRVRWATWALALALALAPQTNAEAADADSAGTTSRITISDDGITIKRRDAKKVVDVSRSGDGIVIREQKDSGADSDADRDPDLDFNSSNNRVHIGNGSIVVDGGDAGIVRMFSDVHVDRGERVEGDVVALFGSIDVEGQIDGNVVAVMGSIRLAPGAVIDGDAVSVGGGLDQEGGANVTGESVSLHFLPIVPGVPPLRALMLTVLACWLFAVIAGGLLWLVVPQRMVRVAETAAHRPGASLLVGLMLPPLAVIVGVLLMITVIGIPVAFLLPLLHLFVIWAGQIGMAYLIGCRMMRRPLGDGHPLAPTLLGAALVGGLFALGAMLAGPSGASRTMSLFFTLLGGLFSLVLTVLGSGAVVVSGFGNPPRVRTDPVPSPATPAVPASPAIPPVAT